MYFPLRITRLGFCPLSPFYYLFTAILWACRLMVMWRVCGCVSHHLESFLEAVECCTDITPPTPPPKGTPSPNPLFFPLTGPPMYGCVLHPHASHLLSNRDIIDEWDKYNTKEINNFPIPLFICFILQKTAKGQDLALSLTWPIYRLPSKAQFGNLIRSGQLEVQVWVHPNRERMHWDLTGQVTFRGGQTGMWPHSQWSVNTHVPDRAQGQLCSIHVAQQLHPLNLIYVKQPGKETKTLAKVKQTQ